ELAFEPKDPQRVLELLTLPLGPFSGWSGGLLAKALTQSPGMGGPVWEKAKSRIAEVAVGRAQPSAEDAAERGQQFIQRIEKWLERPGHDAVAGAPKAEIL